MDEAAPFSAVLALTAVVDGADEDAPFSAGLALTVISDEAEIVSASAIESNFVSAFFIKYPLYVC